MANWSLLRVLVLCGVLSSGASACGSGPNVRLVAVALQYHDDPGSDSGIARDADAGSACDFDPTLPHGFPGQPSLDFMRPGSEVVLKDASGVSVGTTTLDAGVTSDVQYAPAAGGYTFVCTWRVAWRVRNSTSASYTIAVNGHPVGTIAASDIARMPQGVVVPL